MRVYFPQVLLLPVFHSEKINKIENMTQFISTNTTSYSSAFPPLQAFPWTFHKQSSFHHALPSSSAASTPSSNHPLSYFAAIAPPKYPAYLKHTTYASLATDQYQHLQQKKKNSCDDYNKDLVETDLRLPQYWNINDKSRHLQIGSNGYDLTYHAHQLGAGRLPFHHATSFVGNPHCLHV